MRVITGWLIVTAHGTGISGGTSPLNDRTVLTRDRSSDVRSSMLPLVGMGTSNRMLADNYLTCLGMNPEKFGVPQIGQDLAE